MAATDTIHIVCPHCDALNRLPQDKSGTGARCGKCHRPLFEGHPVPLDEGRFQSHIARNDIPVLVDFWADWCGPCKMMAPVFQQAAAALEPDVRLAKVDTDRAQSVALQYAIRSIPTMILFKGGREIARTAGATNLGGLLAWVRRYL